jgi:hypothetical protein
VPTRPPTIPDRDRAAQAIAAAAFVVSLDLFSTSQPAGCGDAGEGFSEVEEAMTNLEKVQSNRTSARV